MPVPDCRACRPIWGEALQALCELTNALRERHYGRMPAEVQVAYDKAWTIVFAGEKSAPAAPQAVQPAVPVGGQSRFKGEQDWGWCSIAHVAMVLATPLEWQNYEVRYVYAHPAEGVPAATVANMPADPTEEMIEVLMAGEDRLHARHGDELPKKRAKERYHALLALAATQPAAQVLDAQDSWIDLKIAFDIPGDEVESLWVAVETGGIKLPNGWSLAETTGSGCAGYVAIFRVDHLPTSGEAFAVSAVLAAQAKQGAA